MAGRCLVVGRFLPFCVFWLLTFLHEASCRLLGSLRQQAVGSLQEELNVHFPFLAIYIVLSRSCHKQSQLGCSYIIVSQTGNVLVCHVTFRGEECCANLVVCCYLVLRSWSLSAHGPSWDIGSQEAMGYHCAPCEN